MLDQLFDVGPTLYKMSFFMFATHLSYENLQVGNKQGSPGYVENDMDPLTNMDVSLHDPDTGIVDVTYMVQLNSSIRRGIPFKINQSFLSQVTKVRDYIILTIYNWSSYSMVFLKELFWILYYSVYTLLRLRPFWGIIKGDIINVLSIRISILNPSKPGDRERANSQIEKCTAEVSEWMLVNKLQLNPSKTEYILVQS